MKSKSVMRRENYMKTGEVELDKTRMVVDKILQILADNIRPNDGLIEPTAILEIRDRFKCK